MFGSIIFLLLAVEAGVLTTLIKRFNQRGFIRYLSVIQATLHDLALHEKPIARAERVFTPPRGAGLVHYAACAEAGDRLRHVGIVDLRLGGIARCLSLSLVPDYRYNLPFFVADIVFMGPRRAAALAIYDTAQIPAEHLREGYQCLDECRARAAALFPLQPVISSTWGRDLLHGSSIGVRIDYRQDHELLEVLQDYLHTWLNMVRTAPVAPPEVQHQVQAGVERFVHTLLEQGGPISSFENRLLGARRRDAWWNQVVFGVEDAVLAN